MTEASAAATPVPKELLQARQHGYLVITSKAAETVRVTGSVSKQMEQHDGTEIAIMQDDKVILIIKLTSINARTDEACIGLKHLPGLRCMQVNRLRPEQYATLAALHLEKCGKH